MKFRIQYSRAALAHLSTLSKRQQVILLSSVREQLEAEPTLRTRNRKPLRPNQLAGWELRIGNLRVFYDVHETEVFVDVKAIGVKIRNEVFIAGEVFEL